jgi:hypothetical protein
MTKRVLLSFTVLLVLALAVPAYAQDTSDDKSTVTFVHGIRGMLADVYLDDELILPGFEPRRATDPMKLKAGVHRIDLRMADEPADSEPAVTKKFTVPPGQRLTAIAHWAGVDDCIITIFNESGDQIQAGRGKLIARHAAATDGVTLTVDDKPLNRALEPTQQLVNTVKAGNHAVAIRAEGSDATLVTGSRVPVSEGTARIVYLIGTAKDDNLSLLTQTVDGLESNPSAVPTGNSGLATGDGIQQPWIPAGALLIAVALIAGAIRRRRKMPVPNG